MRNVPKAELHCHLLGVISHDMLVKLRKHGRETLVAPGDVRPVENGGQDAFVAWLNALLPYQRATWRDYLPILGLHIDGLVAQGVTYTEITVSILMFPGEPGAMIAEARQFRDAVERIVRGRFQVAFLIIIPRRLPAERMEAETEMLLELWRERVIVGVSVAGLGADVPLIRFKTMLQRLRSAGLGISIHAGEHAGPDEVWTAIEECGAQRIGHGIGAFRDPGLVARMGRDGIHLEFCLTSNLKTGAVADLAAHPIHAARDLGLRFSINTDDPGAFGCSMASEFSLLADGFGWREADFLRVYENATAAAFATGRLGDPVTG